MNPRVASLLALIAASTPSVLDAQVSSQRELNGFLIGQHEDAIAASFTTLLQVDTTADGWVNRGYLMDRSHHAYMVFKFSHDRPHFAISVQIAGDSGTPMIPFVGLVLGSRLNTLLARLGKPSRIEHQDDVNTDLYNYDQHNYSVEVDAQGRLASIQILGEDGFSTLPTGGAPSLDSLLTALQGGGDAALQYLTPDVEVYRAGKVIGFRHGAFTDIQTETSDIANALLHGSGSLRVILENAAIRASADVSIRVWEHGGSGWVWKFPPPAAIAELVFKANAGQWRLWEVRYR